MADDVHTPNSSAKVSRSTRWARANRERHNARGADYRAKHPDKAEESVRKYDAAHREARAAKQLERYKTDPAKHIAAVKKYRLANLEAVKESRKKAYYANREANIAKVGAYNKLRAKTDPIGTWIKRVTLSAKGRSKEKNLPFNLTVEHVASLIVTHCPALGCELVYCGPNGKVPNSASLDRIIPELGYVLGNVRVISSRANTIRTDATDREIELIYRWLSRSS